MNKIKRIATAIAGTALISVSTLYISACHTVKGAVNGATQDIETLTGPSTHHRVHHKKPVTTTSASTKKSSSTSGQSSSTGSTNTSTTSATPATPPASTSTNSGPGKQ